MWTKIFHKLKKRKKDISICIRQCVHSRCEFADTEGKEFDQICLFFSGSLHLVKLCLEKGAEVNWKGPKDGWAHVPMIRALATPYKEDLPEIINLLFSKGFKGNER